MRVSHHPHYALRLPEGHPFPMSKYTLVRERLIERGTLAPGQIIEPCEVERAALERVHSSSYLDKLAAGDLSAREQRRLGVPWSAATARRALAEGVSGNLAGGTHHAFADHGEGFCVLNDVAVAIRALQVEGAIAQALVVDLDVHQGNGTAAIFADDPRVFTFSMHGARNYPLEKLKSTLDVELPDAMGDEEYLRLLAAHLARILSSFRPDIVFYLAGVDVAAGDRYGRLALSDAGIRARDRKVIGSTRSAGLPLVLTMAGGYAASPERTAELHAIAYEEAAA